MKDLMESEVFCSGVSVGINLHQVRLKRVSENPLNGNGKHPIHRMKNVNI